MQVLVTNAPYCPAHLDQKDFGVRDPAVVPLLAQVTGFDHVGHGGPYAQMCGVGIFVGGAVCVWGVFSHHLLIQAVSVLKVVLEEEAVWTEWGRWDTRPGQNFGATLISNNS
mmetsp:Transcript_23279/g.53168  ORF Transcript_23279/g.53168 Transcript_23279/m.53168 type:complete len:112 (-) Transcript_23279:5-340(-)